MALDDEEGRLRDLIRLSSRFFAALSLCRFYFLASSFYSVRCMRVIALDYDYSPSGALFCFVVVFFLLRLRRLLLRKLSKEEKKN